jgi:hypothetical protein
MHSAPPVTHRLERSAQEAWVIGLLSVMGVLALWLLALQTSFGNLPWTFLLLACTWLLLVLHACWRWWQTPRRELSWTGRHWMLDGHTGDLAVVLDVGGLLVLRWSGTGAGTAWLWVTASRAARWLELRRAVYSPQ